ncbi:unnamed protein product [Vitrella brassicaformis CCMP3155]|uniref:2-oxoglutarate dehydrogenase, mitochondrial n=2 Tax=Vitrella brassicaformis TaxID=1169539 RepID=A0A0G4F9G5_VITBC|nr:unnamed protein product [Vitrella brassicaformis CCMP3155]|mmetsp:Transcript_8404/g.20561  ORF Transcript_8404/g.20561 Transcript_8404/m.20561 type:complete len:1066 (+) Transcript_8404:52-3249(+)|eukprot:CEM08891.1 unnamed protein product [Vitrella brassicaformis CCMP3155]
MLQCSKHLAPHFKRLSGLPAMAYVSVLQGRFITTTRPRFQSALAAESFLVGESSPYIEQMYEQWKKDNTSVHASWHAYFTNVANGVPSGQAFVAPPSVTVAGAPMQMQMPPHPLPTPAPATTVFPHAVGTLPSAGSLMSPEELSGVTQTVHDTSRIIQMVRGYQSRGHELANIDPLGQPRRPPYTSVARTEGPMGIGYKYYGFTEADLDKVYDCRVPAMSGFLSPERSPRTLREIVQRLEETYCGPVGIEYMHISDQQVCNFVRQAVETPTKYQMSPELRKKIFVRTARAQLFENFCATKFSTSKRFGLDGCETLIVGMKAVVKKASKDGVDAIVLGMPHRGRLNMLMNVMHKPMQQMMGEFQGVTGFGGTEWGNTGDVKYHLGIEYDHWDQDSGRYIHMGILANPSHLEAVNPLVAGQARAQQYFSGDTNRDKVLPIVLHGDASFAGQGVVYETVQMSKLPNYSVGGTIHIVANNQIGFTTYPVDSSSGKYCTDLAKSIDAPIFHVNADDPEAVTFVAELALDFRQRFHQDVFIDLVGYRRYGHNELDMPKFTNPHMYTLISRHPPVLDVYGQRLTDEGLIDQHYVEDVKKNIVDFYTGEYEKSKTFTPTGVYEYQPQWRHMKKPHEFARPRLTGVELDMLKDIGMKISKLPDDLNPHPTIAKTYRSRVEALESGENIDFGLGEALAYGTLLTDGFHVRLTGQDAQRGTFSHRHAVVHDQTIEKTYFTFSALKTPQKLEIGNSNLSEFACLGFETGYALEHPDTLSMWEAQFGDFANGAQVVFDQFITSGEAKWNKQCGIVVLLPHGYDGQGPEHSSARIERFLQACDDREDVIHPESWDVAKRSVIQQHNIQVVNCTSPSQLFHVLRRQMHREFRKPLIIFSPKRMLKMRAAFSTLDEFGPGTRFFRHIPNDRFGSTVAPEEMKRLIFCSGQVFYDLLAFREKNQLQHIGISRVEQLSPFPFDSVINEIQKYPNLQDVVWAQEEPMNMGPWFYCSKRLESSLRYMGCPNGIQQPIYVGRDVSSSPAVGDARVHTEELNTILNDAFDLDHRVNSYYHSYIKKEA